MSEKFAIEVNDLTKSYRSVRVLDGIDLRVRAGTVFALLGPNGAGKTTTVRILATLVKPDGGMARVAGHDVVADRHGSGGASASPASTPRSTGSRPGGRTSR